MFRNFRVDVAMKTASNDGVDSPIVAEFKTDSILELSTWLNSAIEYYRGAVMFDSNVMHVSMLVRCYKDHHSITITPDGNGGVVVKTNQ